MSIDFSLTKADIVDAVVEQWLSGIEQALREIVNQPSSAGDRLNAYVLELHRMKRAKLSSDPELFVESFCKRLYLTHTERQIPCLRISPKL